ncbi:hypothetical protein LCGC14_0409110 [marine sediment metagenome]|uniref:Uncharacterized protein n=1 Tax=marine sediment metagenome TaxID=412755 RepID=A0A0F9VGD3_9ZZZZ|nr:ankyrin repeat domain-containing protein [Phycisphaerae bacterium]
MQRNRTSLTGILIIAAGLAVVVGVVVYFRPSISFDVERKLVGPEDDQVWALLYDEAPLEDIKQAVQNSGKHVDQLVWIGGSFLSNAVDKERKDLVVWLLEQGANPDGVEPSTAPLAGAIWNEDASMVQLLLKHGADPDLDMGHGMTPRRIAINGGNEEVIYALRGGESSQGAHAGDQQ